MAFFQITIQLSTGKVIEGVRELPEQSIDQYWTIYEMKSSGVYRHRFIYFNLVLLIKHSTGVKQHLTKLNPPTAPPDFKSKMRNTKKDHRYNAKPDKTLGDRMKDHGN
jgi:hypothetical protein